MLNFIKIIVFLSLLSFLNISTARYGSKLCSSDPRYACYTVKKGDTWAKLYPNEEERAIVMRINRINIKLHPGMKIARPHITPENLLSYAPLPQQIDPPGKNTVIISLSKLAFGAYDPQGNLVHWGPVSGARGYCPDIRRGCHTPSGKFIVREKRGAGCFSTKFPVGKGGAPMPYCMFFHGGIAMHGSYEVPGYNASHGCIRLFVDDAKWLNQNFTQTGSTAVIVNK